MKISGIRPVAAGETGTRTEKSESPVSARQRTEVPPGEKAREVNAGGEVKNSPKESGGVSPGFSGNNVFPRKADAAVRENNSASPPFVKVFPQNPLSQKSPGIPDGAGFSVIDLFGKTAVKLGFPADFLSAAVLAAGRFFSLSPGAALTANIRRELLASLKSSSPVTEGEKSSLEAGALAAIAALDKGLALSPEALERYSRFFVLPVSRVDGEDAGNGGGGTSSRRDETPDAEELRAIADEEAEKDGLLWFLNPAPGKNGQFWIVFPFKIRVRGIDLTVFLRILKREAFEAEEDSRIIADIAGPKRKWRCFLRKNAGKFRADIRVYPELSPRALASLRKRAALFFGKGGVLADFGGFGEILVRNGDEVPFWTDDLRDGPLPSVNKEV